MLLVLHEFEAVMLRKKGIPALVGVEGSWYEIPVSAITSVEAFQKELRRDKEFKALIPSLAGQEAVSVVSVRSFFDEAAISSPLYSDPFCPETVTIFPRNFLRTPKFAVTSKNLGGLKL